MNHKELLEEVDSITDDPSACGTYGTGTSYVINYNGLKICPGAARTIENICYPREMTEQFLKEQLLKLIDYLAISNTKSDTYLLDKNNNLIVYSIMPTIQESIDLVQSKIKGKRKGMDSPAYIHSLRVYELLKKHSFDENIQMAGLLHDIIEDGGVTMEELKELGYPDEILHLVDLSTHDMSIDGSFEKRKKMLQRLIKEYNKDAWAIKLADISDNLLECHLMPDKDKLDRFLNKKCPVFVYYGNKYFGGTEFYNEFLERYFHQIKSYNQYFI